MRKHWVDQELVHQKADMLRKIVLEKIVPPLLAEFCLQLSIQEKGISSKKKSLIQYLRLSYGTGTFGLIYFIPPECFHFLY